MFQVRTLPGSPPDGPPSALRRQVRRVPLRRIPDPRVWRAAKATTPQHGPADTHAVWDLGAFWASTEKEAKNKSKRWRRLLVSTDGLPSYLPPSKSSHVTVPAVTCRMWETVPTPLPPGVQPRDQLPSPTNSLFLLHQYKEQVNHLPLSQNTQLKKHLTFSFLSVGSSAMFTSIFSRCDWLSVWIAIVRLQTRPMSLSVTLG